MNNQKRLSKELFHNMTMAFTIQIIVISMGGWIVGDTVQAAGELFVLGNVGLTYQSIFQIFICAIVIGSLRTFLLSDLIFKKMMLLWRYVLLMLLTLISTGFLIILFQWIPVDSWVAWVSYSLSFLVFFLVATFVMILKTKLENRRYDKLLSDYKAKQNEVSGE